MCSYSPEPKELGYQSCNGTWPATTALDGTSETTHFDLEPMPHEMYICGKGEDWAGVTNQKVRKKLQNRLNQRAGK